MALVYSVRRRNEHVGAIFDYIGREALGETICGRVEIEGYFVAPPPTHQVDGIWFHLRHEERHPPPFPGGARADVRLSETG